MALNLADSDTLWQDLAQKKFRIFLCHPLKASFFVEELTVKKINYIVLDQESTWIFAVFDENQKLYWYQQEWKNAQLHQFASIKDAADFLKSKTNLWSSLAFHLFRRTDLIQDKLRYLKERSLAFFSNAEPKSSASLGGWFLCDAQHLIYSTVIDPRQVHGKYEFQEDKVGPPSRAYLKLWEFFTRVAQVPKTDSLTLDLGAAPGGWSWVLLQIGARVVAFDKAPLDAKISNHPNCTYKNMSAFAVNPKDYLAAAWVFSDIICYPQKSLQLIKKWLDAGYLGNMVFTIKFQGKTDFVVMEELRQIPGAQLVHLYQNKHELMWYRLQNLC